MRIGIDAKPLGAQYGGIRRYTEELVRGLARVDGDNEYLLFSVPADHGAEDLGPRVARASHAFPLKSWLDLLRLAGAKGRIDLFHGTNYSAPLAADFPTVLTVHDLTVKLFPQHHPRLRRIHHLALPVLCRRAARIIAVSHKTKADLVRYLGIEADKIDVVYLAVGGEFHPIRDAEVCARVRRRYGLPEAFGLFVGSVEPRKNLAVLIRAMAALRREGLPQRLVIAGSGPRPYVESLHAAIRAEGLESGTDVVLCESVENADLPALYSMADVFVYPSLYEGFGLPPFEAMACGAPVLVPDNSSFTELYGDYGLMLDLRGPEGMAEAIRRVLLDARLRGELIEKGLRHARSRTWEDTAAETLAVYRRVGSLPFARRHLLAARPRPAEREGRA